MTHPLLQNSHGNQPVVAVDDLFSERIAAIHLAAEDRSLLLGTCSGHLIRLDQSGKQLFRERRYRGLSLVAGAADGSFGAAALKNGNLVCFDRQLKTKWKAQLTGDIVGLAVSPFGSHIAVSTEAGRVRIVTSDKREVGQFDTPQPLRYLHFLSERAALMGAAEFGHLCCHTLNGNEEWNIRIMNNVGGMEVSGCGTRILLAAFNHGIQMLDESGHQEGSFAIDGIPATITASANRRRLAATTLENRLYWLNFEGDILWAGDLSADPPLHTAVSPLGDRLYVGTESGRLLQLVW